MKSRINKLPAVHPISDSDTANKNVNPGFRNVQWEMSVNEYPGITVNPRYSMSTEQCET